MPKTLINVSKYLSVLIFLFMQIDKNIDRLGMKAQQELLQQLVETNPDTNLHFFPSSALLNNDNYVFDYPQTGDFILNLLIDPCRFNAYNCCVNTFGTPVYPALIRNGLEQERVFKYTVIANESDISANYVLVYEDSSTVSYSLSRFSDDDAILNKTCVSKNIPTSNCQGRNYALNRAALRPPCMDNNQSLNALDGCTNPTNGSTQSYCFQVAYTSNAFVPQCKPDETHCGTYLEIHMAHGNPYFPDETTAISSVQITDRTTSGYNTAVISSNWMQNVTKVLCSYSESVFRINSVVYIKPSAPVCCCPPPFDSTSRVGSFQCPVGSLGTGAFAAPPASLADIISVDSLILNYPFCPIDLTYYYDLM